MPGVAPRGQWRGQKLLSDGGKKPGAEKAPSPLFLAVCWPHSSGGWDLPTPLFSWEHTRVGGGMDLASS